MPEKNHGRIFICGIAFETIPAKEDKSSKLSSRKSPRLFGIFRDEYGIAIRTQWQSGHAVGNAAYVLLKGNRHFGDKVASAWESQPDLCRKIYHIHYLETY